MEKYQKQYPKQSELFFSLTLEGCRNDFHESFSLSFEEIPCTLMLECIRRKKTDLYYYILKDEKIWEHETGIADHEIKTPGTHHMRMAMFMPYTFKRAVITFRSTGTATKAFFSRNPGQELEEYQREYTDIIETVCGMSILQMYNLIFNVDCAFVNFF